MAGLNKCQFLGYLGRDGELRMTNSGTAVLTFSIAATETWKSNGQKQEHTEWIRCVLWGKRAEALAQYMNKGALVLVEGALRQSKYQDRDGNERLKVEIKVADLQLLPRGGGRGARQSDGDAGGDYDEYDNYSDPSGAGRSAPPDDDDIPF